MITIKYKFLIPHPKTRITKTQQKYKITDLMYNTLT